MLTLVLIYLLFFAYLAWRRLDWALMLIIFALWSYLIRFSLLGLPLTLLEAMIGIVFVVWLIKERQQVWQNIAHSLGRQRQTRRYPFDWEIALLLIVSIIAVVTAGWTDSAFGIWKAYFLEPIILFLLAFNVFGKNKEYTKIIYPLAASAFLISLIAIYQKLTGDFVVMEFWTASAQRVTSLFPYPNAVGLYLAPVTMLLLGWLGQIIKAKKSIWQIIGLSVIIILSILAIISAQSDGALIAVLGALVVFGFLASRRLSLITLAVVIMATIAIASQPMVRQKVIDKVTLFDLSGQIRQQQWQETWQMLQDDYWLLGTGLSNYQTIIKPYHQAGIFVKNHDPKWLDKVLYDPAYNKAAWQPTEIYLYPHNILLNFWTELGLLGVLLFVWLIVKYLVLAVRQLVIKRDNDRYLTLGLLGAMLTIIIHGLVDVPYFKNDLAIIFWLLFALLGIMIAHNKK
ncbi:MAG: O-antigen ligase family protein [bacterium]